MVSDRNHRERILHIMAPRQRPTQRAKALTVILDMELGYLHVGIDIAGMPLSLCAKPGPLPPTARRGHHLTHIWEIGPGRQIAVRRYDVDEAPERLLHVR